MRAKARAFLNQTELLEVSVVGGANFHLQGRLTCCSLDVRCCMVPSAINKAGVFLNSQLSRITDK